MQYKSDELIDEVVRIAEEAGVAILEVYRGTDFSVEEKPDNSPLTRADRASNELICKRLAALTPNVPIISEENELPAFALRKNFSQYWLIDPLDGTKEFIKRNDEFAINIALMAGDAPVLGVVHLPAFRKTYFACREFGAWRLYEGQKTRLEAATFSLTDHGLVIAISLSHSDSQTRAYLKQFDEPVVVARGSALKMMMIAEGKVHLHPRFGGTMEWDTAAPQIIVEEAGGSVVQNDGTALNYNRENLRNPDYVVYGKLKEKH